MAERGTSVQESGSCHPRLGAPRSGDDESKESLFYFAGDAVEKDLGRTSYWLEMAGVQANLASMLSKFHNLNNYFVMQRTEHWCSVCSYA